MANSVLATALSKVLNSHFSDFLTQVGDKHNIDVDSLLNEWSEFSGLEKKKKTVIPKFEGPYGEFTVKQLKDKCKSVGLKVGGKKIDLINRLSDFDSGKTVTPVVENAQKGPYAGLTVKELKEKLKDRGLKVGGKKNELIERLNDSDNEDDNELEDGEIDYSKWKVKELRQEGEPRGLKTTGNKSDLVDRLNIEDCESEDESDCDTDCETEDEVEEVN